MPSTSAKSHKPKGVNNPAARVRRGAARGLAKLALILDRKAVIELVSKIDRSSKWSAKYDPAVIAAEVASRLASMISSETSILPELERLEQRAKVCLAANSNNTMPIAGNLVVQYLNYCRQVWASMRKHHGGGVLDFEISALNTWWMSKGLSSPILVLLDNTVLGYRAPTLA